MQNVFIRPAVLPDGTPALVRQPERSWAPVPPEGAFVALTNYWVRRLRDGDVVEADPPAEPEPEGGAVVAPEVAKSGRKAKS